jgi:4-hydroxybutyryl-CoA dehydratase/vinylacetyl-CoA-Delta-isomerase
MNETGFGCALASAQEGVKAESSLIFPHSLYANASRLNGSMTFAEAHTWLGDIAGGLIATMPAESDFANQDIGPLLNKYLAGNPDVPTKDRVRAIRFAEMLGAGPVLHGLLCGGGTPETQKMAIRRHVDLDRKKDLVRKLAQIQTTSRERNTDA